MQAQIADQYRWDKRVILLFAPDERHPALQQQLSILTQDLEKVTDRDLIFYKIFSGNGVTPDGKMLSKTEVQSFYKNYHVEKDGFTFILVGKDGSEKLRKQKPVSATELFELIDSMPMRKAEMKKKGK
ncbi:MAG: DUF4174 domain-containing protein [Saprospiraceae bacterium]